MTKLVGIPGLSPTEKLRSWLQESGFLAFAEMSRPQKALVWVPSLNGCHRSGSLEAPGFSPQRWLPRAALWVSSFARLQTARGQGPAWLAFPARCKPSEKTGWLTSCPRPWAQSSPAFREETENHLVEKVQSPSVAPPFLLGGFGNKQRFIYKEIKRFAFLMG